MNDTSPEIAERMIAMCQQKTGLERLEMGASMYETSRYLVTRFILSANPNISEVDFKKELFLKFYGSDFSPAETEKIFKHFEEIGRVIL